MNDFLPAETSIVINKLVEYYFKVRSVIKYQYKCNIIRISGSSVGITAFEK